MKSSCIILTAKKSSVDFYMVAQITDKSEDISMNYVLLQSDFQETDIETILAI